MSAREIRPPTTPTAMPIFRAVFEWVGVCSANFVVVALGSVLAAVEAVGETVGKTVVDAVVDAEGLLRLSFCCRGQG